MGSTDNKKEPVVELKEKPHHLTNTKQRHLSNSNDGNCGSDSDPDPDMDSNVTNSRLVTIFKKYDNKIKVSKQSKPVGHKVYRDEGQYASTQT